MKVTDLVKDRSAPKSMVIARTKRGMVLQQTNEEKRSEYFRRLEKDLNIERLGGGGYAKVFQHPTHPEIAVKVVTDSDESYLKYLDFIHDHPKNKYVPHVLSVHKHSTGEKEYAVSDDMLDSDYTIVFMEKLRPINSREYDALNVKIGDLLGGVAIKMHSLAKRHWAALSKQNEDSDLATFAKFMLDILESHVSLSDIHENNIMMRGNQPVFTDPLAS